MRRRGFLEAMAVTALGAGAATGAEARERRSPPGDAAGMLYDATRCVGCKACVVACRKANGLPPTRGPLGDGIWDEQRDLDATTKTVVKLYQGEGERAFVKQQCMHCVDPACASACMLGSLAKRERGIVTWDPDRCIGCRYCQIACPFGVPAFEWHAALPRIVKCEMCGHLQAQGREPACTAVCPRQAIVFGELEALKGEARGRIAREPDRYVPRVYGASEAGGTQVLYLAAVPFERLGLPAIGEQPVPELSETIQHGIYKGFIAPAVLYGALGLVLWRNRRSTKSEEGER